MKRLTLVSALSACLLALGTLQSLALDGAIVITHPGANVASLDAATLKDIYTGKKMFWDGGQAVIIVTLDKTDAALEQASGMNASQFKTHWQRLGFSGRGKPPKKADDAAALVSTVASTPGAIALAPPDADLKGVTKTEVK